MSEIALANDPPIFFRAVESEYRQVAINGWMAFENGGERWLTDNHDGTYADPEGPNRKIYSVRTTTGDDGTVVETWPSPGAGEIEYSGDEAAGPNADVTLSAPWNPDDFVGIMPETWEPFTGNESLESYLEIGNYVGTDGSGGLVARQVRWRLRWRSDVATNGLIRLWVLRHLKEEFAEIVTASGVHVPFFYSNVPTGETDNYSHEIFPDTGLSITWGPLGEVASCAVFGDGAPPSVFNLAEFPALTDLLPYGGLVFPMFADSTAESIDVTVTPDWTRTGDFSVGDWEEMAFDEDYKIASLIFYFEHPARASPSSGSGGG